MDNLGTCHHCGAQFERKSLQDTKSMWCPDNPECQEAKEVHRLEKRKFYNDRHYKLYRQRRDRQRKNLKPKKDRRICKGQYRDCKGYIDNENRYYCSVCHRIVSKKLAQPDEVLGGDCHIKSSDWEIEGAPFTAGMLKKDLMGRDFC